MCVRGLYMVCRDTVLYRTEDLPDTGFTVVMFETESFTFVTGVPFPRSLPLECSRSSRRRSRESFVVERREESTGDDVVDLRVYFAVSCSSVVLTGSRDVCRLAEFKNCVFQLTKSIRVVSRSKMLTSIYSDPLILSR